MVCKSKGIGIGVAALSCFSILAVSGAENEPEPILRIESGGHSSFVTSLAWAPGGRELWTAGWDKTVRVWRANEDGDFVGKPDESIRLPIAPGPNGKIDALAFSRGGQWVAIGGYSSIATRIASFRDQAIETPISSVELREQGVIYVLDRVKNSFRRLEGHLGPVQRLVFVSRDDGSELLVSAGYDLDDKRQTIGSIRTWDIVNSKQIDGILLPDLFPDPPTLRPSLGAFRSELGVQVLATSGSGKMFHWDSSKGQIRTYPDGQLNRLTMLQSQSKSIVTASGDNSTRAGYIKFWSLDPAGLLQRDASRQIMFAEQPGGEKNVPLALTPMSSRPGGIPDLIAVVLCSFNAQWVKQKFQIRVLAIPDLGGQSREIVRKDLWKVGDGDPIPEMSANDSSEYLAVAGHPDHEIWIFKTADLLRGKAEPQRLVGQSSVPKDIEFVVRQGELGLRILDKSAEVSAATIPYVFNFVKNQVEKHDAQTWKPDRPPASDWSVAVGSNNPRSLSLMERGVIRKAVEVPLRHSITGFALSASVNPTELPLLVVAAHENGQPWLGVFDVQDGVLKRIFQAHTEPIVSLAISRDSRLLATASKDQTVAVWNISDLSELLRPRSILAGVALLQKDKIVEVERVEQGLAASSVFQNGDQIVGFFDADNPSQLQRWQKLEELSATLGTMKAGSQLKIRRLRGSQSADVMVSLKQAVDVPKPLFQLMITKPDAQGNRQWIGWSPLGPFDASSRQMRQRLGWHLNVRKPEYPVSFVPLDQYPELFSPGLLGNLITNLGKPLSIVPIALIEPRMSMRVLKPTPDEGNEVQVRSLLRLPLQAVELRITNSDFPVSTIKSLNLRIDGKPAGAFAPAAFDGWQVNEIDVKEWTRGPHQLLAELDTNEVRTRNFRIETQVSFVPLSPKISLSTIPDRATKELNVALTAHIRPGMAGIAFETNLFRIEKDGERKSIQNWKGGQTDDLTIETTLDLSEGHNRFLLEATNIGALQAGTASLETVSHAIEIERIPRDMNPPVLTITKLETIENSMIELLTLTPIASQPVIVANENLRLTGKMVASENLSSATLNAAKLPGFVPNVAAQFDFEFPIKLKPGNNSIRLAAKTDVSPEAELKLDVLFQQDIPDIEFLQPIANQVFDKLLSSSTAEFRAIFQNNANMRPLSTSIFVNGRSIDIPAKVDMSAGTITGIVPLTIGINSLQLEVSNDTGVKARTRPLTIYYQPIPVVSTRELPKEIEGASYPVVLTGNSATNIKRVLVDGRELTQAEWTSEQAATQFKLRIGSLPWQSDRIQSVLMIFAEGADKPAVETINVPKRKVSATPPTLVFLNPSDNSSTASEEVVIEYLVQSREPLNKVTLLHDGQALVGAELPLAKSGVRSNLQRQTRVKLRPGLNRFQLYAENNDGMRSKYLEINHVPSPVVLHLDALVPADGAGNERLLSRLVDGSWGSDVPTVGSRHTLKGRVRWNYRNGVALENNRLQVWVAINGFKQPIRLQPPEPESLERTFTCPVQLFRNHNVIEVTAPGLPELANLQATAKVDCRSPERARQRLHLLIVGAGVAKSDEKILIEEAVTSLSGSQIEELEGRKEFKFKSPAFYESIGYALTGASLNRERIETALELIRLAILREPANDVMLLYYRGGEQVYNDGHFYLTTQVPKSETELHILRNPLQLKNFALDSSELAKYVKTYPGTQLLLLDVARTTMGSEIRDLRPEFIPGAATFRYAWLKESNVPKDARLISAWQAAPHAQLELVERSLASQHVQLRQRYQDSVIYENYIPDVLRELVIGTPE